LLLCVMQDILVSFPTIVAVLLVVLFLQQLDLLRQNYSLLMITVHAFFLHVTYPGGEIRDGKVDLQEFLSVHKKRIKKLSNKRLYIPSKEPYMEGHNTWIANHKRFYADHTSWWIWLNIC